MNAQSKKLEAVTVANLRAPFPEHQISQLPKPTKKQTEEVRADFKKGKRCTICGSWHHPEVIHLDYVGHAALTDRLLDTDLEWAWEPLSLNEEGLPAFDRNGGLWIKLTVLGVTRLGYGSAEGKSGGDAVKEIIGDALRNAAMRFGAALDLWHKGDLHIEEDAATNGGPTEGHIQVGAVSPGEPANSTLRDQLEQSVEQGAKVPAHSKLKTELRGFVRELEGVGDWDSYCAFRDTADFKRLVADCQEKLPHWWDGWDEQPDGFVPLSRRIELLEANLAQQIADVGATG